MSVRNLVTGMIKCHCLRLKAECNNALLAAFGNEVLDLTFSCCLLSCSGFFSISCVGLNRRPLNSSDMKMGLSCTRGSMCSLGAWLFWEGENEGSSCRPHELTDPTFNTMARWYLHETLANYSLRQHMAPSVTAAGERECQILQPGKRLACLHSCHLRLRFEGEKQDCLKYSI